MLTSTVLSVPGGPQSTVRRRRAMWKAQSSPVSKMSTRMRSNSGGAAGTCRKVGVFVGVCVCWAEEGIRQCTMQVQIAHTL